MVTMIEDGFICCHCGFKTDDPEKFKEHKKREREDRRRYEREL